nr:uncharacterized mitochondrial protein AtMg00810-like [Tanacetum cinerariifolium]
MSPIRKKRFMCHIIGIEPQFKSIISNGPYIPMATGQRKTKIQWTPEERKAANLNQQLKSLIISSALAPSSSSSKNKGLIAKTYDWDEEEVSSDENEVTEVKALMALANDERIYVSKESANNGKWVKISIQKVQTLLEMEDNDDRKSFLDNSEESITVSNKPKLSEAEDSTLSNHDTDKHPLPSLEKLTGVEPVSRPKTIKLNLKTKSTLKVETLKGIIINEPSAAPARGNKSSSVSKTNLAPAARINHLTSETRTLNRKKEALQAKKVESFKASKTESSSALRSKTPIKGPDFNDKAVNESYYRGMIGPVMNLTESRPNIQFSTALCKTSSKYKESHLISVKNFQASTLKISSSTQTTRKSFIRSPNMYKEYLAEFWYSAKTLENSKVLFSTPTGGIYGKVGVNTFRNSIVAHYLPHSSEYVALSSIDIVRPWFKTAGYGEAVPTKGTLKKSLLPPRWRINIDYANLFWEDIIIKLNKKHKEKVVAYTRFLSLLMMHKMKEGYGDGELTLYPIQRSQWILKLPSPLPMLRGFPKAQSLELNLDTRSIKLQNNPLCPAVREPATNWWPNLLGVTSKARSKPQLSSDMSAFNLNEPIYSTSFIIHSESTSGNDASVISTTEVDLGIFAPTDFIPQQQGMNEGNKNNSYDHLFTNADPHVLIDKTKYVSDGLETVLTAPETGTSNAAKTSKEIKFGAIKLENMAKLVPNVKVDFKDLYSLKDDPIIEVDDSEEDEEDKNDGTEYILASTPPSPSSLLTELKDIPSKFDELIKEVKGLNKQVHELEIELLGDLKEFPSKLEEFTKTITSLTS